ncbi:hypothetical protein Droror1_Dr00017424 [Drosera rotundifolia]
MPSIIDQSYKRVYRIYNIHINMDKEPQYPNNVSSHQHESDASSTPTSLQWPHDLSFRESLMQSFDQSRLFNLFEARHQGNAPFPGAFATHPSPNAHMEYAFIEDELKSAPSISIGVPRQSGPSTSSLDEEVNV